MRHRIQYRKIVHLVDTVDDAISTIIIVAFANNLFFICVQIVRSIKYMQFWLKFYCDFSIQTGCSFQTDAFFYEQTVLLVFANFSHDENICCFIVCIVCPWWIEKTIRCFTNYSTVFVVLRGLSIFRRSSQWNCSTDRHEAFPFNSTTHFDGKSECLLFA